MTNEIRIRKVLAPTGYTVFRYLERAWAEQLAKEGKLLLRPLAYYQEHDAADLARHDASEGEITRTSAIGLASIEEVRAHRPFEASMIGADESNRGIFFDRCTFGQRVVSPPHWAICVSRVHSSRIASAFRADACVRIPDAQKFFAAIANALGEKCVNVEWGECLYEGRDHNAYAVPAEVAPFAKPYKDEYQNEIRAVFYARLGLKPEALSLCVPELVDLCQLLS